MDLPSAGIRSPVYMNETLCLYCKIFWLKCEKIYVNKAVHSFCVSNGSIRLKLSDNERSYIIASISDFEILFPGNEFIRDEE